MLVLFLNGYKFVVSVKVSKQLTTNPKKLWKVRTMEKTLFEQMGRT